MENIEALEKRLWSAADQLRSNSKLTSTEYYMPVLGLIFLRHAYNRYLVVKKEIEKTLPKRGGVARPLKKEDFQAKSALFLQERSQYDYLINLPDDEDRGEAITPRTDTIEDSDRIYNISKIDFEKLKEEFSKSSRKNTTVQCLKNLVEERLLKMLARNPLRADFNKRYQEIISEYNLEKDRVIIEKTFEEVMQFVQDLDDEDKRAVREGLDEEKLALFDLLVKPKHSTQSRNRIKKVAVELLNALKHEKLKIDHWREKDKTRSEVKTFIQDFLWDEAKGLPTDTFTNDEVEQKALLVYDHIFRQYEDWQHHKYAA